LPRKM